MVTIPNLRSAATFALAAAMSAGCTSGDQAPDLSGLQTAAEASGYVETSDYEDVVAFTEAVADASDRIHLTSMGETFEGRSIPMLVIGDVPDPSAESVRASGKLRVYLQGGIHSGEVPGKEAVMMLAREVAEGRRDAWLEEMVLLVVPLYNADGGERIRFDNRPRQHGPIGGMGQRPNAQGLDLNRDHMKLDSPEARSVAAMMTEYDPHLSVDLHTTNGTRHAYHLTYSPPLHPGTHSSLVNLLRGDMLPSITESIREEHGVEFYYYGNRSERNGEVGWYTFDHRPRFNNNYIGLRDRLAILSEAYSYLTFEDRVLSSKWFVEDILDYAAERRDELEAAVREASMHSVVGETLPTRAQIEGSEELVTILMGDVVEEPHPTTGETMLRRIDVVQPEQMREYGTFAPTDSEVVPERYILPAELTDVIERLRAHGVRTVETSESTTMSVEAFAIDSITTAARLFQDRFERTLHGAWSPVEQEVPAGAHIVDVGSDLGRLAFYLLEPRSDDGFANWGLLNEHIDEAEWYPIVRIPAG